MLYDDQHFNDFAKMCITLVLKKSCVMYQKLHYRLFHFSTPASCRLELKMSENSDYVDLEFSLNVFIKEKLGYKDFTIAMQIH